MVLAPIVVDFNVYICVNSFRTPDTLRALKDRLEIHLWSLLGEEVR